MPDNNGRPPFIERRTFELPPEAIRALRGLSLQHLRPTEPAPLPEPSIVVDPAQKLIELNRQPDK